MILFASDPPGGLADISESQSLLRREINHDVSIRSGLLGILDSLLLSVCNQRVVVSFLVSG
jgi:hypothetical protein